MTLVFLIALILVLALAVALSFELDGPVPSMDVLIPVLAIALDVYVEGMKKVIHLSECLFMTIMRVLTGKCTTDL